TKHASVDDVDRHHERYAGGDAAYDQARPSKACTELAQADLSEKAQHGTGSVLLHEQLTLRCFLYEVHVVVQGAVDQTKNPRRVAGEDGIMCHEENRHTGALVHFLYQVHDRSTVRTIEVPRWFVG